MDAIKKKMQSLKTETENAMARAKNSYYFLIDNTFFVFLILPHQARADQLDAEFRAATSLAEKTEESVGFPFSYVSYVKYKKDKDKRQIQRQRQRESSGRPPASLRRLRSRWVFFYDDRPTEKQTNRQKTVRQKGSHQPC